MATAGPPFTAFCCDRLRRRRGGRGGPGEQELEEFGLFTQEEVDEFAKLYFGDASQDRLHQALDPIKERAEQRDEDEQADFRSALKDYARHYAFLSQVLTLTDPDLEKLYVFAKLLRRHLKVPREELPREIQQQIDMDSLRIQRTYKGKIALDRGAGEVKPAGDRSGSPRREEEIEPLSLIIQELNERFGADLGPEDRITLQRVEDKLHEDESLRLSVQTNTEENARLAFETKLEDLLRELVDTNFKLYKRIVDDRDFSNHLMGALFEQYQERVRNGGLTQADVLEEIAEGETKHREFKSSLRWNVHTEENDERITHSALKTIAGFMNGEGGVLYVGVGDDGDIVGIEHDGFPNDDKLLLHLNNVVKSWMGKDVAARIDPRIWMIGGKAICRVECPPSPKPVYLEFRGDEKFYVRSGPSTEELSPSEMHGYVSDRF